VYLIGSDTPSLGFGRAPTAETRNPGVSDGDQQRSLVRVPIGRGFVEERVERIGGVEALIGSAGSAWPHSSRP